MEEDNPEYQQFLQNVEQWVTKTSRIDLLNNKIKEERKELERLTPQITSYMEQNDLTKQTINLRDGKIVYSETSTPSAMSMTFLGETLCEYFENDKEKTKACLEFLNSRRTIKKSVDLKRKFTSTTKP